MIMLIYYIWLHELKGVGLKAKKGLLKYFGTPKAIYEADYLDFPPDIYLKPKEKQLLTENRNLHNAECIMEKNIVYGINVTVFNDKKYKLSAGLTTNAPLVLYYKGKMYDTDEFEKYITFVGTRQATQYGKMVCNMICDETLDKKTLLISGFATGIDTQAHCKALDMGCKTYGFVANGLDMCYPAENAELLERITESGAIISTYSVGIPPRMYQFIARNKIMVDWSDEIYVIEGGSKSGAVMTGRYALDCGKKVYAVPNSIFILSSAGCNELIQEGAVPYLCSTETLDINNNTKNISNIESKILKLISTIPCTIDDMKTSLNCDYDYLKKILASMELKDYVQQKRDGKWYCLSR